MGDIFLRPKYLALLLDASLLTFQFPSTDLYELELVPPEKQRRMEESKKVKDIIQDVGVSMGILYYCPLTQ